MRVLVEKDYDGLSAAAARVVARQALAEPRSVLLLPTGETPKGMYDVLVRLVAEGLLDLSGVTVFNLDEYLGPAEDDPHTFRSYMKVHLWDKLPCGPAAWHIPSSQPEDAQAECLAYERALSAAGTVGLAVLGIGENGHIAYNEPGTPWERGTHVVELAPGSQAREAARFGSSAEPPRRAITVGVRTIMRARRILLLANGERKAGVLARALEGPVSSQVPASVLQLHPRLTAVVDAAAASALSARGTRSWGALYSGSDRAR